MRFLEHIRHWFFYHADVDAMAICGGCQRFLKSVRDRDGKHRRKSMEQCPKCKMTWRVGKEYLGKRN